MQWGTQYQTAPNLIIYPLPVLVGEAATQSTVDLFINESLRFHSQTGPGPFQIDQPQDDYGSESNQYGDSFIAGRYRRGLTENLTAQALAEWSESHELVGVSGITTIPRLGAGGAGISASDSSLGTGTQIVVSIERQSINYGFGVRVRDIDRAYVQMGSAGLGRFVKDELFAYIRFRLWKKSNASLIHTRRNNHDQTSVEIFLIALTRNLGRNGALSLSASVISGEQQTSSAEDTALEDFRNKTISATYTRRLGKRQTLSVEHKNQKGLNHEVMRVA